MTKTTNRLIEIVGWLGVVLILAAYLLNNLNLVPTNHPAYILMNLLGALAIAYDAYKDRNAQPLVLNLIWALIAIINLIT